MTLFQTTGPLTSTQTSIDIALPTPSSSEPNIKIELTGKVLLANNWAVSVGLQMNHDTRALYSWANVIADGILAADGSIAGAGVPPVGLQFSHGGGDEYRIRVGWLPASSALTKNAGTYEIIVPRYGVAGFNKQCHFSGGMAWDITHQAAFEGYGYYNYSNDGSDAPALTYLTLVLDAGTFEVGTVMDAYTF